MWHKKEGKLGQRLISLFMALVLTLAYCMFAPDKLAYAEGADVINLSALEGDESGTGWFVSGTTLFLGDGADVQLTGSTTYYGVSANGSAAIELFGANIDLSELASGSAIRLGDQGSTNATVNLTLTGDNTLKGGVGGAGLEAGCGLTIGGTGSLTAVGGAGAAGIGGSSGNGCHEITITGGTIDAKGGGTARAEGGGAGIGGGKNGDGGTVVISGGEVAATGGYEGAGIGGGQGADGGDVNITNGTVTAVGGDGVNDGTSGGGGAGIGGGNHGHGGLILISGGTVNATGKIWSAGIGGGSYGNGGSITIAGGAVTAQGGPVAAGIGGGTYGRGGTITIDDGAVNATGGELGAGIGSGYMAASGTITINGGDVTAQGGSYAAGIGSATGSYGNNGSITITGGAVSASGGQYGGAGIGGGNESPGGTVDITGGVVSATGFGGAGIGGGKSGSGGAISITGGMVTAVGEDTEGDIKGVGIGDGGRYIDPHGEDEHMPGPGRPESTATLIVGGDAVVFARAGEDANAISVDASKQQLNGGIVFENNTGSMHGDVTAPGDFTIEQGQTLMIAGGTTLTIPTSVTLTNNGTIYNAGAINGRVYGSGTIADAADVSFTPMTGAFEAAEVGYGQMEAQQFTVKNIGAVALTSVEASISAGGNAFVIASPLSTGTLAIGGSAAISVKPKTGLSVGEYTGKLTISAPGGFSKDLPLSFSVIPVPVLSASLTPPEWVFAGAGGKDVYLGYAEDGVNSRPDAKQFLLRNVGSPTITTLSASITEGAAYFDITTPLSETSITTGQTAAVFVRPKPGLGVGKYQGALTIEGNRGFSASAGFAFTVLPERMDAPSASPGHAQGPRAGGFAVTLAYPGGASVYYTLDGTNPTKDSSLYTGPVTITGPDTTVLKAKTVKEGYSDSETITEIYSILKRIGAPSAAPVSGIVEGGAAVALSCENINAEIRYTLNESEPTGSSNLYVSPLAITTGTILKAKAFPAQADAGVLAPSETATFHYTPKAPANQIAALPAPNGTIVSGSTVELKGAAAGGTVRYTTDGGEPSANSQVYSSPIVINAATTVKAKLFVNGWVESDTVSFAYTAANVKAANPSSNVNPGVVPVGAKVALACSLTTGATIRYTTNGSEPTESSAAYSSPIAVNASTTLKAKAFKAGCAPSDTQAWTYTVGKVEKPVAGIVTGKVVLRGTTLSLSCPTAGAVIRYTTNGAEPTEASTAYTSAIVLNSTANIRVKAFKTGLLPSDALILSYTVMEQAAAPTASRPSGQTVPNGEKVSLYSATSGATIRYTINGAEPTSASKEYDSREPITILADNPTFVVKARAFKNGCADSNVSTFSYIVGAADPASFNLGKFSVTLPGSLPMVGGKEVSMNLENMPGFVNYKDGKITAGIGYTTGRSISEETKSIDQVKNAISQFNPNTFKPAKVIGKTVSMNCDVYAFGYVEGVLPSNGNIPPSLSGKLLISMSVNGSVSYNTVLLVIPVTLTLSGEARLTAAGGITLQNRKVAPSFVLDLRMSLSGSVGIGVSGLSAGGYGDLVFTLNWSMGSDSVTMVLSGEVGLYEEHPTLSWSYYKVWVVKIWYPVVGVTRNKWAILSGTIWKNSIKTRSSLAPPALYETEHVEAPRPYLPAQSAWKGGSIARARSTGSDSNGNIKVLQSSVYNGTQPLIGEAGGKLVMVFLADDGTRDDMNFAALKYSVYNSGNDTWSVPDYVANDGTIDGTPSLAGDGTNLWVAWGNAKTKFDENFSHEDMINSGEICAARFNGTEFVDVVSLTDNDIMDAQPDIVVNNGNATVAWLRSSVQDLDVVTASDIITRTYNGAWGEPATVASGVNIASTLSAGYFGGGVKVAYMTDDDNDIETTGDMQFMIAGLPGAPGVVSSGAYAANAKFTKINGADVLTWHENDKIHYMRENGEARLLFGEDDITPTNYQIVNSNNVAAVLYPHFENGAGYMAARVHDSAKGAWGGAFKLAATGDFAQFYSAVVDSTGAFRIAYNNQKIAFVGSGENTDLASTNDLCVVTARPQANIRLADVYYNPGDIALGQNLPTVAVVENIGGVSVNSVEIKVGGETVKTETASLLPGGRAEIGFNLAIPGDMAEGTKFVVSSLPVGVADSDTGDNEKEIVLGAADLALKLTKTEKEDGTVEVAAEVKNASDYAVRANLLVHRGSLGGEVVDYAELGALGGRSVQTAMFTFDPRAVVAAGNEFEALYFEAVSDKTELYGENNHDFVAVFAANPEVCEIGAFAAGNGSVAGGGYYAKGSGAELTASADAGYEFAGWYDGETKVGGEAGYRFAVSEAKTFEARFTASAANGNEDGGNYYPQAPNPPQAGISVSAPGSNPAAGQGLGNASIAGIDDNVIKQALEDGMFVIVDGKPLRIGEITAKGNTMEMVVNESAMLEAVRSAKGPVIVVVPQNEGMAAAMAQFTIKIIDELNAKNLSLIVATNNASVNFPAGAIDTAAVRQALGYGGNDGATLTVGIEKLPGADGEAASYRFTVTAAFNGKTFEVGKFNNFVSRDIKLAAAQAKQVATAVVLEKGGARRHVPTSLCQDGDKYYARIKSRTNSDYSLIFNDVKFEDAAGKWYEKIVNEMGSRKIVSGVGNNKFDGERAVTRAEFAATLVNAFGLQQNAAASTFVDVGDGAWYKGSVGAAYEYGLMCGRVQGVAFDPMANITCDEAAMVIKNAMRLTGAAGSDGLLPNGGKKPVSRAEAAHAVLAMLRDAGLIGKRDMDEG